MSNKKKYTVDISLDLLEIILGLSQDNFAIASIDVDEEGDDPSLSVSITRTPILSVSDLEEVEIPDIPIHQFGCGHSVPCWQAAEILGDQLDEQ